MPQIEVVQDGGHSYADLHKLEPRHETAMAVVDYVEGKYVVKTIHGIIAGDALCLFTKEAAAQWTVDTLKESNDEKPS